MEGVRQMRSIEQQFYWSKEWKRCREAYKQSKSYLCERCLAKGIYSPGKIVHHKVYLTESNYKDPSVSLNFNNLELLCADCHEKEHFSDKTEPRYKINQNGELIF